MKTNYLQNAIIGMGFGFPVTLVCMALFGGFHPVLRELMIWMAASALYGILSGVIFTKNEEFPLPVAVGLHCLGCIVITLGAAALCGYVTGIADILPVLIPALIIYALIYGICILMMKHNEKQINQVLQKK